jgi:hypothetical protein
MPSKVGKANSIENVSTGMKGDAILGNKYGQVTCLPSLPKA